MIELGDQPYALDTDGDTVWVSGGRGHLVEVNGLDVTRHPHPTGPLGIAVAKGVVWTTSPSGEAAPVSEVIGYEAATGKIVRRIPLGRASPYGIDAEGDRLYVALYDGALLRIDTKTGDTSREEVGEGVTQVLVAHGFVWVSQPGGGVVWRLTRDGTRPQGTEVSFGRDSCPQGTAATDTSVLVADPCGGKVWLVDPRGATVTGEVTDVGTRPVDVAVGDGLVYVVSMRDDRVTVLDEHSLRELAHTRAGDGASSVTVADEFAWVANTDEYSITRIELRRP